VPDKTIAGITLLNPFCIGTRLCVSPQLQPFDPFLVETFYAALRKFSASYLNSL
jgi:hypothetical protein